MRVGCSRSPQAEENASRNGISDPATVQLSLSGYLIDVP
jgi:hypothetical protein